MIVLPAPTYEPIASTTLGTTTNQVDFTSIPQTYTDLVLILNGGGTVASTVGFAGRVGNGSVDTGSNYSYTVMLGTGASANSARRSNQTEFSFGNYNDALPTTITANSIIHIQNYSNTTTNKTILVRYNRPDIEVVSIVGLWRSTSAINTLRIFTAAGNYLAGSTFSLYGIRAA